MALRHARRRPPGRSWPIGAVAGLLLQGPAGAQAPDTSNWTCSRCPFPTGYEASYSAGASHVSEDAAHFGDATGYDEEGGYVELGAGGSFSGEDGRRVRWRLEDLGLDARSLRVDAGRQGTYGYYAGLSQLPRREFDTTRTVFSAAASDTLTLPGGWVRGGQTAAFPALGASLFDRNIESDRTTIEVGGHVIPVDRFSLYADYRRTERDGVDIQGATFFTTASLLPRPFDYETDELDIGLRYAGTRSALKLAYYGSYFRDRNLLLRWDNPFNSFPGAELGALAQPPDSSFQQFLVSGTVRAGWRDTVVTYSAATGVMEQDDPFVAYTTNPNLAADPLPRSTLDGRVDTTNLALTLTSRPHARARVKLAYRYDERDNRTPVAQWSPVIVDSFASARLEENVPYGFERSRLNLRADIDVRDGIRLAAGYDYRELERDFQEVAEQDETSAWGQVAWQPTPYVDLKAKAGAARREVDRYDTGVAVSLGQNPLMRKFHLAYRYREFGELSASASWPESSLSVSATLAVADDSYTESRLGLLSSDEIRAAADLSWAFSDTASLYIMASRDEIDSEQAGSALFAAPDWRATHADDFVTFGAGYRIAGLAERFDLAMDYTRGKGRSRIDVTSLSGPSRFPDLESELDSVRVRFGYRASDRLEGYLDLRYERFDADDWALEGVAPATIPNVLSLDADPYDYDVVLIGLGVRYSFSGGDGNGAGGN